MFPFSLLFTRGGLMCSAAALIALAIGLQTLRLAQAKHDLAQARAAALVVRREKVATAISTDIAQKTEVARVEVRWRTRTLIEKVPQYVPAAADAACTVPVGFVRLHDAAAAGLPAPAGGPEQAASGVPLSGVLGTIVENYGVAYDWRAEALAWREWYDAQRKAWGKR